MFIPTFLKIEMVWVLWLNIFGQGNWEILFYTGRGRGMNT